LAVLAAVAGVAVLISPSVVLSSGAAIRPVGQIVGGPAKWLAGDLTNIRIQDGELVLADEPEYERAGQGFGFFVSPIQVADAPFDQVSANLTRDELGLGELELEVRSSPDAVGWSSWFGVQSGASVALPTGRFLQYRAELRASAGERPALREVSFQLASTGAAAPPAGPIENPTVRVFGTREGLVGRKTANGHTVQDRDHFVALPSRRVLNPEGKTDYQVKLTYKGKSAIAPVWDVGPWNIKDNYWDERRDMFGDLPRFVPQAYAAWKDEHNGGRDQYNRWVSIPASIDIADGTFIDDLGMGNSDWVDVTFLFVKLPSPAPGETPPVLGLKPEPKPPTAPDNGQTWYFAEGNSEPPFQTFFTLFNASDQLARATLTYMKLDGSTIKQEVTVKEGSRLVISADKVVPKAKFGLRIDASRPVFAERSVYFGSDGHSSTGANAPNTTWYLAEGSTSPPFDTWILLQNPGSKAATVNLTFMKENGENQVNQVTVPAMTRQDVHTNDLVARSAFATKIVSDQPIVAERSVYLARGGGHNTLASAVTSKNWYFADGSTDEGIHTWILIQNPTRNPTDVTVTYLREDGSTIQQKLTVGATSRVAINTREALDGERFGAVVEANQPIVAERAMYFGGAVDGSGTGASDSLGAPDLAKAWYLPDGTTVAPYHEWILVANPGDERAEVKVEFTLADGGNVTREYDVDGHRRLTIDVDAEVPNARLSAKVSANQPVVVERSTYLENGSGGTNSLGIPR
jgi:hypothetical protein